jgi:hypothetical protein
VNASGFPREFRGPAPFFDQFQRNTFRSRFPINGYFHTIAVLIKELRTSLPPSDSIVTCFQPYLALSHKKLSVDLSKFCFLLLKGHVQHWSWPPSSQTYRLFPEETALVNYSLHPAIAELFSDDEITKIVPGRECPRSASPRPGVRRETLGCDPKPESAAVDSGGPITLQYFIKFGANVERRT